MTPAPNLAASNIQAGTRLAVPYASMLPTESPLCSNTQVVTEIIECATDVAPSIAGRVGDALATSGVLQALCTYASATPAAAPAFPPLLAAVNARHVMHMLSDTGHLVKSDDVKARMAKCLESEACVAFMTLYARSVALAYDGGGPAAAAPSQRLLDLSLFRPYLGLIIGDLAVQTAVLCLKRRDAPVRALALAVMNIFQHTYIPALNGEELPPHHDDGTCGDRFRAAPRRRRRAEPRP